MWLEGEKNLPIDESGTGGNGLFKRTRPGTDLSMALDINLTVSGTAINGTDYNFGNPDPGATTIIKHSRVGKGKHHIQIVPVDLGIDDGAVEKVKLTILPGESYTVGPEKVARVKIVHDW